MKWLPFATKVRLSRLVNGLALVALFKLTLVGAIALDVQLPLPGLSDSAEKASLIAEATAPALDPWEEAIGVTGAIVASVGEKAALAEEPAPQQPEPEPQNTDMLRESLMRKQDELNNREASLRQLEKELDSKLRRLNDLEAKLKQMLEEADQTKDKKLRHLVDVYSNMKAKQAAAVLETLDEDIAVKILAGMRGRQAGEILSFVNPAKAAKLSEALTRMQVPFQ